MARLATFIDGGYLDSVSRDEFRVRPDYGKLATAIVEEVTSRTVDPVELFRTFYYHCPPYQSSTPTPEEAQRYGQSQRFFDTLRRLQRFEVRLGRLAYRGLDGQGKPIFQQKRVDLLLGLDFALLAGRQQIQHAAIISGDSDLIPAVQVAKEQGVCVWLFHGPRKADGSYTYARELWDAADERVAFDDAFMKRVAR